jgi:hypothetical protein
MNYLNNNNYYFKNKINIKDLYNNILNKVYY